MKAGLNQRHLSNDLSCQKRGKHEAYSADMTPEIVGIQFPAETETFSGIFRFHKKN